VKRTYVGGRNRLWIGVVVVALLAVVVMMMFGG